MNLKWFRRKGVFFMPASLTGWIIFMAAVAYAVYVFIDLNNRDHSVSDLMINFVFSLIIIGAIYSLVAYLAMISLKKPDNR